MPALTHSWACPPRSFLGFRIPGLGFFILIVLVTAIGRAMRRPQTR